MSHKTTNTRPEQKADRNYIETQDPSACGIASESNLRLVSIWNPAYHCTLMSQIGWRDIKSNQALNLMRLWHKIPPNAGILEEDKNVLTGITADHTIWCRIQVGKLDIGRGLKTLTITHFMTLWVVRSEMQWFGYQLVDRSARALRHRGHRYAWTSRLKSVLQVESVTTLLRYSR